MLPTGGLNVCNGQAHDFSRLCQDYELFNPGFLIKNYTILYIF